MALAGAAQVVSALRSLGHRVVVIDTCSGALDEKEEAALLGARIETAPPSRQELAALSAREDLAAIVKLPAVAAVDVAFLVLHGQEGEGGEIQSLLERAAIRFTGSDAAGSRRAMDKNVAKSRMERLGVPTPPWRMWPEGADRIDDWSYPVVIKPSRVGSSVGLSVARGAAEVGPAVEQALGYDREVLIEAYLPGRELTVGVLGDQALGVGEIRSESGIFDYHGKYTAGVVEEIFPAEIEDELARELRELALAVHRGLGLRHFSRVDFRLDERGRPSCLEVNTLPGMTEMSLLPQSAQVVGVSFPELCQRIVELALED